MTIDELRTTMQWAADKIRDVSDVVTGTRLSTAQIESISGTLRQVAATLEGREESWPPYGVPVEVDIDGHVCRSGNSLGDGSARCGANEYNLRECQWRIMPVDWRRVDPMFCSRAISMTGDIFWYTTATPTDMTYVYHIDNRPEGSNE